MYGTRTDTIPGKSSAAMRGSVRGGVLDRAAVCNNRGQERAGGQCPSPRKSASQWTASHLREIHRPSVVRTMRVSVQAGIRRNIAHSAWRCRNFACPSSKPFSAA